MSWRKKNCCGLTDIKGSIRLLLRGPHEPKKIQRNRKLSRSPFYCFYFLKHKNLKSHLFNLAWKLARVSLLAVPLEMLVGAPGIGLSLHWPSCLEIGFYCLFGFVKIRFDGNAPHYLVRYIYFECLPGQVPSRANLKTTAKSAREKLKHIKY